MYQLSKLSLNIAHRNANWCELWQWLRRHILSLIRKAFVVPQNVSIEKCQSPSILDKTDCHLHTYGDGYHCY